VAEPQKPAASPSNVTTVADYVRRVAESAPKEAVAIALAEAEREKSLAVKAESEYRSLSEITFDDKGRIEHANMAGLWRLAKIYAYSAIVPEHYRVIGNDGRRDESKVNDCFIACQMAFRLRVDPFAYMQASYVVHGKPGVEAKLAVAMLNVSGKIRGRVRYEEERDPKGAMTACVAFATDAETGDKVSARVTWAVAVAEGWVDKKGSKWKTMPELMFHYRSAAWLIRQFYPEVLMGMSFTDELEDAPTTTVSAPARTLNELSARLGVGQANGNGHHAGDVPTTAQRPSGQTEEPAAATAKQPDLKPTETRKSAVRVRHEELLAKALAIGLSKAEIAEHCAAVGVASLDQATPEQLDAFEKRLAEVEALQSQE